MEIGNKMFELRKKKEMSQEQLAEKLNVTRQTISNWELNQTLPDIKQTEEMAKIFNVTLDELVGNDIKDVLIEKVNNTQNTVDRSIKALKVILISIIYFIIFSIILVIIGSYIFKQNKKNNKETEISRPIVYSEQQIKGNLNGLSCIYKIYYDKTLSNRIIDIDCILDDKELEKGHVSYDMILYDTAIPNFLWYDVTQVIDSYPFLDGLLDYIKGFYEYRGGTWEMIEENNE